MVRWLLAVCMIACLGCGPSRPRVVVYCALDREFSEPILQNFSKQTGIEVVPRFDSEANKAVGLVEDLLREKNRPRCDVHWNNEILGTIRLGEQGVFEAYPTSRADQFPAQYRSVDGTWTGIAARARVVLVNTSLTNERPKKLEDLLDPKWRGRVAIAKPQFGTTATFAACLVQSWGDTKARDFFERLKKNDARILPGNKHTADAVAKGQVVFALTDTDDALGEISAKRPVEMLLLEEDTLLIPNTVALVRGAPNSDGARKLIDYLLSPEVESKLAAPPGGQIPLNPAVTTRPPFQLPTRTMAVDFPKAAQAWDRTQQMLKTLGY